MKKLLFATKIIAKNTNILPKKMKIKQKIAIAMMNSGSRKQNGYFSMYISVSKDYQVPGLYRKKLKIKHIN